MKIAILSLRFAPGHIAHLRAYKELFVALGCEVKMFLDKGYSGFIQNQSETVFSSRDEEILEWSPDVVFSYNVSKRNIKISKKCRKKRIPFYYVLHEPWDSLRDLLSLRRRLPRRLAANYVNYLTAHYAYKVVLASETGVSKYCKYMKGCNKNYAVFPLIFCDDYDASIKCERRFISFIGGFTETRGCREFLEYVRFSIKNKRNNRFCIATRNHISGYIGDTLLQKAIAENTLIVFEGKPMTSEEINLHYREAICSWNAYINSTQSGVLPNALMQGSPVLVTDRGDTKNVVTNQKEGCYVSLPLMNSEIDNAVEFIKSHVDEMSEASRESFCNKFNYKIYLDKAQTVFEIENNLDAIR